MKTGCILLLILFSFINGFSQTEVPSYNDIGNQYYAKNQLDSAFYYYEKALMQYDSTSISYTTVLQNMAFVCNYSKRKEEAEHYSLLAIDIRRNNLTDTLAYFEALKSLSKIYKVDTSKEDKTEDQYLFILSEHIRLKKHYDIAYYNSLKELILFYYFRPKKVALLEERLKEQITLSIDLFGKYSDKHIANIISLASFYKNNNKYQLSEHLYQQILPVLEDSLGLTHSNYLKVAYDYISLYAISAQIDKGNHYFDRIRIAFKNSNKTISTSYYSHLLKIADFNHNAGYFAKADVMYDEAKHIYKQLQEDEKKNLYYTELLNKQGLTCRESGNYSKAEAIYLEALTLTGTKSAFSGALLNNLALVYTVWGKYKEADSLLWIDHHRIQTTKGDWFAMYDQTIATNLNNLAYSYNFQERYAESLPLIEEVVDMRKKITNKDLLAKSLYNLANAQRGLGDYINADQNYIESRNLVIDYAGKFHPNYAILIEALATSYEDQGKYEEAYVVFKELTENLHHQIIHNFPYLSEKEKIKFYARISDYYQHFNSFALRYHTQYPSITEELYNHQLTTKALLFRSSRTIAERITASKDQTLISLYVDWKRKKDELSKLHQQANNQKVISQLEEEINQIEKELSIGSEAFKNLIEEPIADWKSIQGKLKSKEAAVEIIRIRHFDKKWTDSVLYVALIIKKGLEYPEMVVLENGNELEEKYANYYKNVIKHQVEDEFSYQQYWERVAKHLNDIKKIYYSPDGIYNRINLNTLYDIKSKTYLKDKVKIILLTATKDILKSENKTKTKKQSITLFGYPDYSYSFTSEKQDSTSKKTEGTTRGLLERIVSQNGNIETLPGTKKEVERIAHSLSQTSNTEVLVYIGAQANEKTLKQLQSPEIIHIATHGFFVQEHSEDALFKNRVRSMSALQIDFAENPLHRTGLVVAGAERGLQRIDSLYQEDGILTAYEAANLHLEGTKLVVLSACETGLGEIKNGEGVYSLQRSFQQAGAKYVLMSLWKVSDEATQEMMQLFYQYWIKNNHIEKAFRSAQNAMLKKYQAPYYWGAFVLVGME